MELKRLDGVTDGWAYMGIDVEDAVTRMAVVRGSATGLSVVVQRLTSRGGDAPLGVSLRIDIEGAAVAEAAELPHARHNIARMLAEADRVSEGLLECVGVAEADAEAERLTRG